MHGVQNRNALVKSAGSTPPLDFMVESFCLGGLCEHCIPMGEIVFQFTLSKFRFMFLSEITNQNPPLTHLLSLSKTKPLSLFLSTVNQPQFRAMPRQSPGNPIIILIRNPQRNPSNPWHFNNLNHLSNPSSPPSLSHQLSSMSHQTSQPHTSTYQIPSSSTDQDLVFADGDI